jgi:hypothetical protein
MMKSISVLSVLGIFLGFANSSNACTTSITNVTTLESKPYLIVFSKVTICNDGNEAVSDQVVVGNSQISGLCFTVNQTDFDPSIPGQQNALLSALEQGPNSKQMDYLKTALVDQIEAMLSASLPASELSSLLNDINASLKNAILYIR